MKHTTTRRRLAPLLMATIVLGLLNAACTRSVSVHRLTCEHLDAPLGIDVRQPRFGWQIADPGHVQGQCQTAYRILVASTKSLLNDNADMWDSGVVTSSESQLAPYEGAALQSGGEYFWKVMVYDRDHKPSAWSTPARFSIGLLDTSDWKGRWIKHPSATPDKHIWFRKNLTLDSRAASAFIYVASEGYHELYVNGQKADERVLAPALTRLDKRVLYVTYDIAPLLRKGNNTIAVWYASGWSNYTGWMNRNGFANLVDQALLVQLNGTTAAGDAFTLHAAADWKCTESYSRHNGPFEIFNMGGEGMDGRRYTAAWNTPDFDDSTWEQAVEAQPLKNGGTPTLSAQMTDPSRIIETIAAQSVTDSIPGTWKVKMGKTFTGFLEARFNGLSAGDTVFIKISDRRDTFDTFHQDYYYVARGEDGETFRNRFNYAAGRYVHLTGLKRAPQLHDIKGYAVTSAPPRTSRFECSDPLFNRIYQTDLWTFEMCTTEGYTSDCPNRERLGYGSEAAYQTTWGGGLLNFASAAFYQKYVRDWSDVQFPSGEFYFVAPQVMWTYGSPQYCVANMNIAWEHYLVYGDPEILEEAYTAGKKWLDFTFQTTREGELFTPYANHAAMFLGDWLGPGPRTEFGDLPEAQFFSNCVHVMSLQLLCDIADALGRHDEAEPYRRRIAPLKAKIHDTYYNPATGAYANGDQVRTAWALFAGVVPDTLRPAVLAHLKNDLTGAHPYFDIGSSSRYPYFKTLLAHPGIFHQTVADLLSKTTYPSYGYFLQQDETTWPEAWEARVDAHVHTSYVGISAWLIKGLAGIEPAAAGSCKVSIRPNPVEQLTFARAAVQSPYGEIESGWRRNGNAITYELTVPVGVQADVYLPDATQDDGYAHHAVAAGKYTWDVQ